MKKIKHNSIYFLILASTVLLCIATECKKEEDPVLIITDEVNNIGSVTASCGATITWEDASAITGRGICWSTKMNPSIEEKKTSNGKGPGNFKCVITGLLPNTSYYIRSYVIKNGRVIYGNPVSFKTKDVIVDIDGNTYNTITIGNQVWLADNLRTTHFSNGDPIATTTPANLNIMYYVDPVYQWAYDGLERNTIRHGRLYTWYTLMDPRGLCPEGWHVPSDEEWTELENYLISNSYNYDSTNVGNKLALGLVNTKVWEYSESPGTPGNTNYLDFRNKTGFSALPSGYRNEEGRFTDMGNSCSWWSSTEASTYNAYYRYIRFSRKDFTRSSYYEFSAMSVRCIKD